MRLVGLGHDTRWPATKVKRDTKRIEKSPSLSWGRNPRRAADNTDLFTSAHTPVDFVNDSSPDHFEQDDTCSWVQHLLSGRAVRLVLYIGMRTRALPVNADAHDVWYVDFSDARRVLGQSSELVGCFVFGVCIMYRLYSCAAWMINRGEYSDRSGLVDGRGRALSVPCAHRYMLSKAVVLFREVCQPTSDELISREGDRWHREPRSATSQSSSSTRFSS